MKRLLQCFAEKPNTVLLYIAGAFHTVCMTARVKSHDARYMGGQTQTHAHTSTGTQKRIHRGRGCGGGEGMRRGLLS